MKRGGRRPAVTVLMCAYQRARLIADALDSVYTQDYKDFEVIVVDDGSTDGTGEAATSPSRPRLSVIRLDKNEGPAAARNAGLRHARGEFVALIDSDDLWYPRHLSLLLPAFADARVMVSYSNLDCIDAAGKIKVRREVRPGRTRHSAFRMLTGLAALPSGSSAVIRRRTLRDAGGYDEGFRRIGDDVDLHYRIALRHGPSAYAFLDRSLSAYRRHGIQQSIFAGAPEAARSRSKDPAIAAFDDMVTGGEARLNFAPDEAAENFFRRMLARWPELSDADRERLFDVVYFYRKHAHWTDLLLGRPEDGE